MSQALSKKRIVVLVSGSGSNLQAIMDECDAGFINASVVGVISNRPDVYALTRAQRRKIPNHLVDHRAFDSRASFDAALAEQISAYQPDLIVLAGFMRILSQDFVCQFAGKMLNIHPSLLPKYLGLNTHKQVLNSSDTLHGASVHFVNAELDGGPVVLQSIIKVNASDTIASLQSRVAITEWRIYPLAVKWFCDETLRLTQDKVWFSPHIDFSSAPRDDALSYEISVNNKVIENAKDTQ